jgi:hypothetical protein
VSDAAAAMTPPRVAPVLAVAAALLGAPAGADAQTSKVVVPAGAQVVVPPRGSALPRPVARPVSQRPRLPPLPPPARDSAGLDPRSAGTVAGVLLSAIAAAAITAALSDGGNGGGGTTSGPVRTR